MRSVQASEQLLAATDVVDLARERRVQMEDTDTSVQQSKHVHELGVELQFPIQRWAQASEESSVAITDFGRSLLAVESNVGVAVDSQVLFTKTRL